MTVQTAPAPVEQRRKPPEPMVHLYHCSPRRALCGENLRDGTDTDDAEECVVCIDLAEQAAPCSRLCGPRTWLWWHFRGRWSR